MISKNVRIEITEVTEFENESSMELTVQSYKVNGTYSGVFKSMTGSEYQLRNGVISNVSLVQSKHNNHLKINIYYVS